jgi:hypothetical protein
MRVKAKTWGVIGKKTGPFLLCKSKKKLTKKKQKPKSEKYEERSVGKQCK